jgi:trimeric autotransporter adhesin
MNVRTSVMRGFALLALSSLTFAACDERTVIEQPMPITVTVTPQTVNLQVGQSTSLVAVVANATNQNVTWTSANPAVATVNAQGQITAVAAGTAVITAASVENPNARAAAAVTVTAPPPAQITLQLVPATASVQVNQTVQMVSVVGGTTNNGVTYTSSATGIATVDAAGLVRGVAPGTAVITARTVATPQAVATSTITVTALPPAAPVQITIAPSDVTVQQGGTQQFTANVTGSANTAVIWRSNNASVATVNDQGMATAEGAGTAVITAIAAADTTRRVTAVMTVTAVPQASITIEAVTNAAGVNLDLTQPVAGTIYVRYQASAQTINNVRAVSITLGTHEFCRQTFTTALNNVVEFTCELNTAAVDASYQPLLLNGSYPLGARLMNAVVGGDAVTAAADSRIVTTANQDRFTGKLSATQTLVDAKGDTWHSGSVTATIYPTLYSGTGVDSLRLINTAGTTAARQIRYAMPGSGAAWTATWAADSMANRLGAFTVSIDGVKRTGNLPFTSFVSAGDLGANYNLANRVADLTLTAPVASQWIDGSFPFVVAVTGTNGPAIPHTFAWFQGTSALTAACNATAGSPAALASGAATIESALLAETTGFTRRVRAQVTDAFGNCAAAVSPTFGVDRTAPIFVVDGPADGTIVNAANAGSIQPFSYMFEDALSGMSGSPLRYQLLRRFGMSTDTTRYCTTLTGSCTSTSTAFQESVGTAWNIATGFPNGYYRVIVQARDSAGNTTQDQRVILVDKTAPTWSNVTTVTTGTASVTAASTARDAIDLGTITPLAGFGGTFIPDAMPTQYGTFGFASRFTANQFFSHETQWRRLFTTNANGNNGFWGGSQNLNQIRLRAVDVAGNGANQNLAVSHPVSVSNAPATLAAFYSEFNADTTAVTAVVGYHQAGNPAAEIRFIHNNDGELTLIGMQTSGLIGLNVRRYTFAIPAAVRTTLMTGAGTQQLWAVMRDTAWNGYHSVATQAAPSGITAIGNPGNQSIFAGDNVVLAKPSITGAATVTNRLTWSSSNPSVASVSINASTEAATITGVTAGTATITIRSVENPTIVRQITITVSAVNVQISAITGGDVTIDQGEQVALGGATVTGAANTLRTWSSSNTAIATVNASTGLVTGVSAGTVTITAEANANQSVSATTTITVRDVVITPTSGTAFQIPANTNFDLKPIFVVTGATNTNKTCTIQTSAIAGGTASVANCVFTTSSADAQGTAVVRVAATADATKFYDVNILVTPVTAVNITGPMALNLTYNTPHNLTGLFTVSGNANTNVVCSEIAQNGNGTMALSGGNNCIVEWTTATINNATRNGTVRVASVADVSKYIDLVINFIQP